MPTIHRLSAIVLAAAAAHTGAQDMSTMPMPAKPTSSTASRLPVVEGEIRKLDAATGVVVLKHGDIPNLAMPAMTMAYDTADKKLLVGRKVGEKVRFQVDMVGGRPTVMELKPVK